MSDLDYVLQTSIPMTDGVAIEIDDLCSKNVYVYGFVAGGGTCSVWISPTLAGTDWFDVQDLDPLVTDHLVPISGDLVFRRIRVLSAGPATFVSAVLVLERR